MKVAFVYRNLNRSGSLERESVFLLDGLVRRGVEVHCYCDPGTSGDVEGVVRHDVTPLTRSRSRLGFPLLRWSFARRATKTLRAVRDEYDLVHVLGVSAWEHDVVNVPAVMAADQARWATRAGIGFRATRARTVLAPALRPEIAAVRAIERLQFRPGHYLRVNAVTEEVGRDLIEVHGVPEERIRVLPPAVDVARFAGGRDGRLRRSLGLDAEGRVILFVGHAFERKGLEDAIAALQGTPRTHLVVVGGGDVPGYKDKASALGVAERVHFEGPVDTPEDYYAAADLLVLPTRSDPWGVPVIEAMAAGVPVVTTAAAGSAALAVAAGAAVLVPPRSPRDLGEVVAGLLNDPDKRREMGERGNVAAARFDVEAVVDATLSVYEQALEERKRA